MLVRPMRLDEGIGDNSEIRFKTRMDMLNSFIDEYEKYFKDRIERGLTTMFRNLKKRC